MQPSLLRHNHSMLVVAPPAGFVACILFPNGSTDIETGTSVLVLVEDKVNQLGTKELHSAVIPSATQDAALAVHEASFLFGR